MPDQDDEEFRKWKEAKKRGGAPAPSGPPVRAVTTPDDAEYQAWKASRPAPTSHSPVESGALGLSQGLTLGFADELEAAADALGDRLHGKKGTYEERLREARGLTRAAREENPKSALAGEVTGALTTGVLGGGARAGLTMGRAMAEGAGYGAVAGAGNAEGDLTDRAKGAASGAAIGAAAVPIVGGVVKGATGLARRAGGALLDATGTRPLGAAASSTAPGPIRATVRQVMSHVPGVETAEERGIRKVAQAVTRDQKTVPGMRADLASRPSEKPETVMELAGDNTRRLATAVRSHPGPGSSRINTTLAERQMGAEERAINDAIATTGAGSRMNLVKTADQLVEDRAKEAQDLYQQAFRHGAVDNPRINQLLELPYFQKAWAQAKRLAELDEHQLPEIFEQVQVPGKVLDAAGNPTTSTVLKVRKTPDVQTLHYVKLGLDDVIEDAQRAPLERGGLSPTAAQKVLQKQREFLSLLDRDVPAYETARNAYAGRTRMMEALEEGRKLFTRTPDEIAKTLEGMSDSERELFRKGGTEALANRIESLRPGSDVTSPAAKTLDRKRLRHLFPSAEAFEQFKQELAREAAMMRTNRAVTGNSQTVDKAMALADLVGINVESMAETASKGAWPMLVRGMQKLAKTKIGQNVTGNTEAVADAASKRLTAGAENPADLQATLDEIERAIAASNASGLSRRRALLPASIAAATGARSHP